MAPGGGDARAERFDHLYQQHFRAVYRYVLRRVPAGADPDDLVAEVFAVAWRRFGEVPEAPADRWWLLGVARKHLSNEYRARTRWSHLVDRSSSDLTISARAQETDAQDDTVQRLLEGLSRNDQEILRLVLWDELSHAEAGAVLGCSANAAGVRYHRALRRMKKALTAHQEERQGDISFPERGGSRDD